MASQNLILALAELYDRMLYTGNISDSHRRVLTEALDSPNLKEEERVAIDRLLVGPTGKRSAFAHHS